MIVPKVYAHRGFSALAPENTLVAFMMAVEVGATGIELDVQLSKDGEVMVCHDERVDRTTDQRGLLVDYTYAELRKMDAGSWFSSEYANAKMPTLKEVLEFLSVGEANRVVELNIELKTGVIEYPGLEEKVLELTHHYGLHQRTIYSSFNHYSLNSVRKLDNTARTGVLYMSGIFEPWEYAKKLEAEAIHPIFFNIRPELVEMVHQSGLRVNPFTVDDEARMKQMILCGVDGIITNYPDRLLNLIKSMEK